MKGYKKLKKELGKNCRENILLSKYTTSKIGGPARYFSEAKEETDLVYLMKLANKHRIPSFILAGGSNLLISDGGFNGLVIHNRVTGLEFLKSVVRVKSGMILQVFIDSLIDKSYGGLECLSGIPGTVGGAIYGNAGAYGQTISDHLKKVKVFDGRKTFWLTKAKCGFAYRESIFKKNNPVILAAEFKLDCGDKAALRKKADEIIKVRTQKYPPTLNCPGSFFKNIEAAKLPNKILAKIPKDKIIFGKIPAGYLLEAVGAKGASRGDIKIADYHGNLIFNLGQGTAEDFFKLASRYANKVKEKFGIELEPEVQLVGFEK